MKQGKVEEQVSKKKILVIDDEKDFGRVIQLGLERFGFYEVDLTTNGFDGLRQIAEEAYDVIILDILMPIMEGQEVLKRIKAVSDTPVVILSAYIPPQMEEEIIRQGAFACVRKPIEQDQLILIIHKALASRLD